MCVGRVVGSKQVRNCVEQRALNTRKIRRLCQTDEVVQVDIRRLQWRTMMGVERRKTKSWQHGSGRGLWSRAILSIDEVFQGMGLWAERWITKASIADIRPCLGEGTEIGWGFVPSHWEREREGNKGVPGCV